MFAELRLVAPRPDRQETYGGKLALMMWETFGIFAADVPTSLSPGDVRKEPPRFVPRLRFCCLCVNANFLVALCFPSAPVLVCCVRSGMEYEAIRRLFLTRCIDQDQASVLFHPQLFLSLGTSSIIDATQWYHCVNMSGNCSNQPWGFELWLQHL